MIKVILDTNFLLIPFEFKVDIVTQIKEVMSEPFELCIIDKTKGELESIIEKQRGIHRRAASFGLKVLEVNKFKEIQSDLDHVDDFIVELANHEKIIVATQDKVLKKKIQELGSKVIVLRQKSRVVLV